MSTPEITTSDCGIPKEPPEDLRGFAIDFPPAMTVRETYGGRRILGEGGGFGKPIAAVECDIADVTSGVKLAWRDMGKVFVLMQWVGRDYAVKAATTFKENEGKWVEVPLIRTVPKPEVS